MIRKGDNVIVTTGKEKGKIAKVIAIFPRESSALLEKLNKVKRHQKPTAKLRQGGIVEKEAPIHVSKMMLYCSKCSKGVRVGSKVIDGGKKVRFCRKCQEVFA
ncbi:MAG: 50S ribosomal protein L24 [Deltaproteobacteria bacterium]|nr:50S ribosomal protein L24 [Deltaproteobacteria bacterium]